jgi:hypothetical protein
MRWIGITSAPDAGASSSRIAIVTGTSAAGSSRDFSSSAITSARARACQAAPASRGPTRMATRFDDEREAEAPEASRKLVASASRSPALCDGGDHSTPDNQIPRPERGAGGPCGILPATSVAGRASRVDASTWQALDAHTSASAATQPEKRFLQPLRRLMFMNSNATSATAPERMACSRLQR